VSQVRSKAFYLLFVPIIFLFFDLASGSVDGDTIRWWSINAGGNVYDSSTNYKLCGSVGQFAAGKDSITGTTVAFCYSGFWNPWVRKMTPVEWEDQSHVQLPREFDLRQNYPNPFNPNTVIEYALPKSAHVTIEIYNLLGQKVNVLVDEDQKVGRYRVDWDGKDKKGEELASGIYFYRIQAGDFVKCKKMIMLK
jgi:hypothetical protein